MIRKQTIAIVGADQPVGTEIAKSLSVAGYRLILTGENDRKLETLAVNLNGDGGMVEAHSKDSIQSLHQADIIMISSSGEEVHEIANYLSGVSDGKIIVSTSGEFYTGQTEPKMNSSVAEELQKMLPNAKVVKTFSMHLGSGFGSPLVNSETRDTFIAGNDLEAVTAIADVIHTAGYFPILAGELSVSRKLEKMQAMFHQLTTGKDFTWYARWKALHS